MSSWVSDFISDEEVTEIFKRAFELTHKEDKMEVKILQAEEVEGKHLVIRTVYCCYVFLDKKATDALKWNTLIFNFVQQQGIPSANALFPPTEKGWSEAVAWAYYKCNFKEKQ